jgi:DNA-binding transcriptional LysR family regulator
MHSVRHLELVRALATHRHFGRAAEAMGVSQPSLTRGLRYLETTLGAQLFDRANPITPTAFGEVILRRGEVVLGEFSELLREVQLLKGLETGALSVCTGPYPADISALEALGRLSRKHPNLACTLLVKDGVAIFEDVAGGRCDLGIVDITDIGQYPDLDTEILRKTALNVFCRAGHPLSRSASVSLDNLFDYPWVVASIPKAMQAFLAAGPRQFGYYDADKGRMWPRVRVETFAGIKRVVVHSDGLGAAPYFAIADDIASKDIVTLPIVLPWLSLNYGFVWRRGRSFSPAATAFMAIVREIEQKLGP